jgi:hypothetical protein
MLGAGVLGNLQSCNYSNTWAISLGQFLAVYMMISSSGADADEKLAKGQEVMVAINAILTAHNIPFTVPLPGGLARQEAGAQCDAITALVQGISGPDHCALLILGVSACFLRHSQHLRHDLGPEGCQALVSSAKARLQEISTKCSALRMKVDALWLILEKRPAVQLSTGAIQTLLIELTKPLVILVVSSDPKNVSHLRLAEDRRELEHALRAALHRDSFQVRDIPSCRIRDIARALDDHNPDILYFTGHGNSHGLCFENDAGRAEIVSTAALAALLQDQDNLKIAILNSCYSHVQAQCIADAVGYVVGMEGALRDRDAIDFGREFFTALGNGRTFEESFRRAKAAVLMNSSSTLKPHFLTARPADERTSQSRTDSLSQQPGDLNRNADFRDRYSFLWLLFAVFLAWIVYSDRFF